MLPRALLVIFVMSAVVIVGGALLDLVERYDEALVLE